MSMCSRFLPAALVLVMSGCASPYYADQGALLGGLGGAGVGALVGHAVGHTGAGALIGAGVGALSGGAVGAGLDEIEARNRAQIEAHMQRRVAAGAVSFGDVIAMTEAGVDEDLIVTHIRANGVSRRPATEDLITLQERGVSKRVISALQTAPSPSETVVHHARTAPVIIEEHYYEDPWWPHRHYYHHHHGHPGRVGVGISYHSGWH
jgi:hypothetical protein